MSSSTSREFIKRSSPIVEEEEEEAAAAAAGEDYELHPHKYQLPPDDPEFTRLDPQHRKNTLALGRLYTCPELVKATLTHDEGRSKSVLDLGCGPGVWAVEMALQHPGALVVGVTIGTEPRTVPAARIPPNCQFETHDINFGLAKYYNMFDVVHMRNLTVGIRNFSDSVQEAVKCLRPGGLFLLVEGDYELYHSDMVTLQEPRNDKFRNGSWAAKLLYHIRDAKIKGGNDILGAIASVEGGLWGYPGFDEDSIGAMSLFTPLGPWPESPNRYEQALLHRIGDLQREFWTHIINKSRTPLVQTGMPGETIDQLIDRSSEEVANPGRHRVWIRTRCCWGRRLLADGTPAQDALLDKSGYAPLPASEITPPPSRKNSAVATTSTSSGGIDISRLYRTEHYYYTRDSVRVWKDARWRERKRIGSKAMPASIPWDRVVLPE